MIHHICGCNRLVLWIYRCSQSKDTIVEKKCIYYFYFHYKKLYNQMTNNYIAYFGITSTSNPPNSRSKCMTTAFRSKSTLNTYQNESESIEKLLHSKGRWVSKKLNNGCCLPSWEVVICISIRKNNKRIFSRRFDLTSGKGWVDFNPGWVIIDGNKLNIKKTAQKHALVCKIKFWWRKVSSVFWFGHYLRHSLGYFGFSRAELHFQKFSRKKVRKTGGVFGH